MRMSRHHLSVKVLHVGRAKWIEPSEHLSECMYSTLKEITHLQDVFDKQRYVSLCTGTYEGLHGRNVFTLTYYVYSVVLV